jgi:hypothetical protein
MDDDTKESSKDSAPPEPSPANGDPNGPSQPDTSNTFAAIGEPDTLPLTFCRKCQVEVKPEGKGRCPRCQTFLRLNFVARKGPVNVLRRDQLHAENIAEYKPDTLQLSRACRRLANIDERLENAKEGTTEYQRLFSASNELTAILVEASRSARGASAPPVIEVRRVIVGSKDPSDASSDAGPSVQASAGPAGEAVVPTSAPAPEPTCGYGCGSLARCAEIKATRPEAWAVLHYTDPIEVERRDAEATAVMMRQIGKPLPDWYRR